jgi:hypothetical protein
MPPAEDGAGGPDGATTPPASPANPERVIELRRQALERAGYRPEHACALAERLEVDLQHAASLPKQGFPPDVAYELIVSGSRPVF